MNNRLILGLSAMGGLMALAFGLAMTGCTGSTASLDTCVQLAQQMQAIQESDPCKAAQGMVDLVNKGCFTYLSQFSGDSGPSKEEALASANEIRASSYCTGQ